MLCPACGRTFEAVVDNIRAWKVGAAEGRHLLSIPYYYQLRVKCLTEDCGADLSVIAPAKKFETLITLRETWKKACTAPDKVSRNRTWKIFPTCRNGHSLRRSEVVQAQEINAIW
jgi:hypothetical protein